MTSTPSPSSADLVPPGPAAESASGTEGAPGANKQLVLVIVALAQFLVVLDLTIVNVALPSIQRSLKFSPADLQWVVNAYALLFGGFLLLGGRIADLVGRRRIFIAGLGVFAAASLFNGLAQSSGMLVAGRAVQGLGGALLSPAALSIVTTTFAEGRERTRALGVWSAISAGGGAVGLLLGGVLTDTLSWEWVFLVTVPFGVAGVIAALRYVPESRGVTGHRSFDLAGAFTVTGGMVLLVFTTVKAQEYGWASARTVGMYAASIALLAAFVAVERRTRYPLMRLSILRVRSLAVGNAVMFFAATGLFSMFYFISLYAQDVLRYSPLRAGLAFLPMSAGVMAGATVAQQLLRRFDVRAVAALGLTVAAGGMVVLLQLRVDSGYLTVLFGIVGVSIGMGTAFVPLTLLGTSGVDGEDAGLASGLFNSAQQIGGAVGLAVLTTLAANRTSDVLQGAGPSPSRPAALAAQVDGFHLAFIASTILFLGCATLLVGLLRRRHLVALDSQAVTVA